MISRQQYINFLESFIVDCKNSIVEDARQMALDAFALVKRRILETGTLADGSKISGYSEAVVPYWFFRGKGRSESNLDKLKKKGYFVSYKQFRESNNLRTDHVDLFVTGEFWNSMEESLVSQDGNVIIFIVKPKDEENLKKLEYLSAQKGLILDLSLSEIETIATSMEQRKLERFRRFNLAA